MKVYVKRATADMALTDRGILALFDICFIWKSRFINQIHSALRVSGPRFLPKMNQRSARVSAGDGTETHWL